MLSDLGKKVRTAYSEVDVMGLLNEVSLNPSSATQDLADAFLQVAVAADTWGMRFVALQGLFDVLEINPSAANSTMVNVVDLYEGALADEVRQQVKAIQGLLAHTRPELNRHVYPEYLKPSSWA